MFLSVQKHVIFEKKWKIIVLKDIECLVKDLSLKGSSILFFKYIQDFINNQLTEEN